MVAITKVFKDGINQTAGAVNYAATTTVGAVNYAATSTAKAATSTAGVMQHAATSTAGVVQQAATSTAGVMHQAAKSTSDAVILTANTTAGAAQQAADGMKKHMVLPTSSKVGGHRDSNNNNNSNNHHHHHHHHGKTNKPLASETGGYDTRRFDDLVASTKMNDPAAAALAAERTASGEIMDGFATGLMKVSTDMQTTFVDAQTALAENANYCANAMNEAVTSLFEPQTIQEEEEEEDEEEVREREQNDRLQRIMARRRICDNGPALPTENDSSSGTNNIRNNEEECLEVSENDDEEEKEDGFDIDEGSDVDDVGDVDDEDNKVDIVTALAAKERNRGRSPTGRSQGRGVSPAGRGMSPNRPKPVRRAVSSNSSDRLDAANMISQSERIYSTRSMDSSGGRDIQDASERLPGSTRHASGSSRSPHHRRRMDSSRSPNRKYDERQVLKSRSDRVSRAELGRARSDGTKSSTRGDKDKNRNVPGRSKSEQERRNALEGRSSRSLNSRDGDNEGRRRLEGRSPSRRGLERKSPSSRDVGDGHRRLEGRSPSSRDITDGRRRGGMERKSPSSRDIGDGGRRRGPEGRSPSSRDVADGHRRGLEGRSPSSRSMSPAPSSRSYRKPSEGIGAIGTDQPTRQPSSRRLQSPSGSPTRTPLSEAISAIGAIGEDLEPTRQLSSRRLQSTPSSPTRKPLSKAIGAIGDDLEPIRQLSARRLQGSPPTSPTRKPLSEAISAIGDELDSEPTRQPRRPNSSSPARKSSSPTRSCSPNRRRAWASRVLQEGDDVIKQGGPEAFQHEAQPKLKRTVSLVSDAILVEQKRQQMKVAADKGDYVLAGRLQEEIMKLEEKQNDVDAPTSPKSVASKAG